MRKKQWDHEAEQIHSRVLEFLTLNEAANIAQYTDDLFKVFSRAYESGYCGPLRYYAYVNTGRKEWIRRKPQVCGDSIWEYALRQGWVHPDMSDQEERYRDIHLVMTWWDAWALAFGKIGYRSHPYRFVRDDPYESSLRSQSSEEHRSSPGDADA